MVSSKIYGRIFLLFTRIILHLEMSKIYKFNTCLHRCVFYGKKSATDTCNVLKFENMPINICILYVQKVCLQ